MLHFPYYCNKHYFAALGLHYNNSAFRIIRTKCLVCEMAQKQDNEEA